MKRSAPVFPELFPASPLPNWCAPHLLSAAEQRCPLPLFPEKYLKYPEPKLSSKACHLLLISKVKWVTPLSGTTDILPRSYEIAGDRGISSAGRAISLLDRSSRQSASNLRRAAICEG